MLKATDGDGLWGLDQREPDEDEWKVRKERLKRLLRDIWFRFVLGFLPSFSSSRPSVSERPRSGARESRGGNEALSQSLQSRLGGADEKERF